MSRRQAKHGRPSKYEPGVVAALAAALIDGADLEQAARAANIGASTLYRWLHAAKAGDPQSEPLDRLVTSARAAAE